MKSSAKSGSGFSVVGRVELQQHFKAASSSADVPGWRCSQHWSSSPDQNLSASMEGFGEGLIRSSGSNISRSVRKTDESG